MREPKIKVTPLNKKHRRLAKILEEYDNIAHFEMIEAIRFEIFNPHKDLKARQKAYKDYNEIILRLKPVFKKLVRERNRLANEDGYKNYFHFATTVDGIPWDKLNLFFSKADKLIKDINQNLPLPNSLSKWYWSEFNIPDALYLFKTNEYSIPGDIYRLVEDVFPKIKKILPRIKIEKIKGFNPRARFIKETKSVIIEAPTKPSIYNALTFVHELGHAISFLKLVEKGKDSLTKSRYWREKEAYKFKFQFEELCLPEEVKNASRGEILGDFATALFEYEIYNNPEQDFDKAYAQAINRCYPGKAHQQKNPFYVLENNLVSSSCSVVTASVAEAELLSKNLC